MSKLATEYVQSSFTLPRKVEFIESDLSNGYLFLAMLNQLGKLSEEDFERASDESDPDVVLENYRLLAQTLSSELGIRITRKDVANMVSETPGAAAALVMQIKRFREKALDSKYSRDPNAYKKMIATQRKKEFSRKVAKDDTKTPKEQYLVDAKNILDNGVFAEIDMKCLLQKFETHTYEIEEAWRKKKQEEEAAATEKRKLMHDEISDQLRDVTQRNHDKDVELTMRWKKSLENTKKRHVRDLQFELATLKIDTLRRRNRSTAHREESISGIEAFEANLKRSGIGGNDDDGNLSISYEDQDNFNERITTDTRKKLPSDEETNDFMTQLKVRTATNRTARYEKARREKTHASRTGRVECCLEPWESQ